MTTAIEPLKTQIREADQGRVGIALAGVRQRLEEPPRRQQAPKGTLAAALERGQRIELAKSARAAHAIVLVDGDIEYALRLLRRRLQDAVMAPILKRLEIAGMNRRDRYKKERATSRRLKAASRRRRREVATADD